MRVEVQTDIPLSRRPRGYFNPYFEALTGYGQSTLVPYDDWTVGGKYKLLNALSARAHHRKVNGLGVFTVSMETQGVRIWRVR